MAKKGLTQANTLRSNNTTSTGYGIVYADEIIGSRSVETKEDLNKLPDWVLGKDNKLEKGTTYYVENEKCFYIYTGDGWQKSFKSIGLPVKSWYAYDNDVTETAATSQILDISKIIKGDDLYVDTQDGIEEQPHPFATIVVYNDEVNKVPIAYITLFESSDPDNPENNTVVASAKVFGVITNHVFPKTPDFRSINYYEGSCRPLDTGSLITNWKLIGGNSIINKVWELNDFSIKGNTIKTSEIDFTTDTLQKFNDSISSGNHVIKTQYSVVDVTHDNIVGQMLLIGDSLGHMVTEILTTSAELKDGVIDWNAHSDTEVNTYIRRNHVKEGGTSSIAVGSWSKWTYYSGEGQYNDFKILVARELSKKVNTSDVVQQTGDSTTSVMSQKAVTEALANLPDKEDLTFVKESGRDVLKIADRRYAPENFSGKGYKILRKNMVDGNNILTQDMINESNTIYEIRYNFDLDGKSIIIPNGCSLRFNGGLLSNGKLVGDDTKVEFIGEYAGFNDITLLGTWSGHIIDLYFNYTEMSDAWKLIYNLTRFNYIELKREEYYIDTWKTITVEHNLTLNGNGAKLYLPSNKGEIVEGGYGNKYKTAYFIYFGYSCNNVRIEDLIILDKSELCPEGYGWSKDLIGFIIYNIFGIENCGETNIINVRYNGGGEAVKSWDRAKKTDVNIINCDFTCGGFCIEICTQTRNGIVGCLENVRLIGCRFDLNIGPFVGALSFVGPNYITNIFIRDCIIYMHGSPETFCKNMYMYNNTIYGGICSEQAVAPINALVENNTFISQKRVNPYTYIARNIEFRKNTFKFEKDAQYYISPGYTSFIDKIVFIDNNIFVTDERQITLILRGKVGIISNNNIFGSRIDLSKVRYDLPYVVDELNYFHFSKYGAMKPSYGIGSKNWVATTDLLTGLTLDSEGYTSIDNEEVIKNVIVDCPEQVCSVEIHSKKGSGNLLYVLDFKIGDKVCHLKVEYNNWNIYIGDTTGVNHSTLINADDEAVYRFTLDWQDNNNVIISIFKNDVFQKNGIIEASLTGTSVNITAIRGTTEIPFNRLSVLRGGVI